MAERDSFANEALALHAEQEALDGRFKELLERVKEEGLLKASSDFAFSGAEKAEHLAYYLLGKEDEYLGPARPGWIYQADRTDTVN